MINTYKVNRKIRKTYDKNAFIYMISLIPLIGDLVTNKTYNSKNVKVLYAIYTFFKTIWDVFAGKILYLLVVIGLSTNIYTNIFDDKIDGRILSGKIVLVLMILAIAGGFLNNPITTIMSETYSSVMLLRMDARKYSVSNYVVFLIKHFIGSVVVTLVAVNVTVYIPKYLILFYPLYTILVKICVGSYVIKIEEKNLYRPKFAGFVNILNFGIAALCVVLSCVAYVLINIPGFVICFVSGLLIIFAAIAFKNIYTYDNYKYIYKMLLRDSSYAGENDKANTAEIENYKKMLEVDDSKITSISSNKKSYDYFNDIFIKRHRGIFYKHSAICSGICALTVVVCIILTIIFRNGKATEVINELVNEHITIFLFIIYFINRGEKYTKAYFYNCDCSMLTYNFYRKKETVINLFKLRLKSIIKYNILPALIIAAGVDVLYFIAGGEKTINYVITPISIIAMSMFFSIHYIFLYYVLQPFNEKMENKNVAYSMCVTFTYVICYNVYNKSINSLYFCPIIIAFTIIYAIAAYIVINTFGYKRFRINS